MLMQSHHGALWARLAGCWRLWRLPIYTAAYCSAPHCSRSLQLFAPGSVIQVCVAMLCMAV
jgi:hypothetical protein